MCNYRNVRFSIWRFFFLSFFDFFFFFFDFCSFFSVILSVIFALIINLFSAFHFFPVFQFILFFSNYSLLFQLFVYSNEINCSFSFFSRSSFSWHSGSISEDHLLDLCLMNILPMYKHECKEETRFESSLNIWQLSDRCERSLYQYPKNTVKSEAKQWNN